MSVQGLSRAPAGRKFRPVACAAALLASMMAAQAAPHLPPPQAERGRGEFPLYWTVTQSHDGWGPENETDLDGLPISRNAIILYQAMLGRYPFQGPHVLLTDHDYMRRHLEEVERDVESRIPAGYDGLVVIDYEKWWLSPERTKNDASDGDLDAHDKDFLDDVREVAFSRLRTLYRGGEPSGGKGDRDKLEAVYRKLGRRFFVATIRKCKSLRPEATWGFYNYPHKLYNSGETPPGVKGYGDGTHEASRINDRLDWLVEEVDALFPQIYAVRKSLPDADIDDWHTFNRPHHDEAYVSSMVAEARRMSEGQVPVYPITSMVYQGGREPLQPPNQFLNFINMRNRLQIPRVEGADGVVIWGALPGDGDTTQMQEFIDTTLSDAIDAALGGGPDRGTSGLVQGGR